MIKEDSKINRERKDRGNRNCIPLLAPALHLAYQLCCQQEPLLYSGFLHQSKGKIRYLCINKLHNYFMALFFSLFALPSTIPKQNGLEESKFQEKIDSVHYLYFFLNDLIATKEVRNKK